ncbi:MAG: hypothetical protein Q7S04_00720 [Candidatus Moranbacteria bacterium]|nr:hypothetical protein [Candidatus Moranbacteria bacterium]
MLKRSTKMGTGSALVIALLSFGAFVGAAVLVTKNQLNLTAVSLANDGEDGGGDSGGDEDKDEDKDDSNDSSSKSEKEKEKKSEEAKKQAEREREDTKKQLERSNKSSDDSEDDEKESEDINDDNGNKDDSAEEADEIDEADEINDDNNGMFKERAKTLEKLREEIAKAREKILEKQGEGVDATAALARLALAEAGLTQVGSSFDVNDLEKAKLLAKQIKKETHFTEKDLEFSKKVAEEMAKVEKRFGQVEKKIVELGALSGDTTDFKSQLASLRSDFSVLKTTVAAAPGTITRDMVKAFEKRVKRLKSLVESTIFALGGTDDDDLFDDHKDDADDLFENLNDVAEIEDGDDNGVSGKVRKIAAEHKASTQEVEDSLQGIKDRSGVTKVLFGPNFNALDSLTTEVTAMGTRATALESASTQITDPEIKQILVDQAKALRSEVTKLQAYIAAEDNQFSIFGKFLSLFR